MTWLWIIPMGLAVGVALGALGGGGAILTIPVLIYLLHEPPTTAAAGSLVIVLASSFIGAAPHLRHGNLRILDGVVFGGLGTAGAVLGSRWSAGVREAVLLSAFAGLLLVVAAVMTVRIRRQPDCARGTERTAEPPAPARTVAWAVRLVAAATLVGLLTGFFGVGGGFAVVPALVLVVGLPMRVAVGTSLLVIALNSATALATRMVSGVTIDWAVVAPFALLAVAGSLAGARLGKRVDQCVLGQVFAALLAVIGVVMAAQNVPQVW